VAAEIKINNNYGKNLMSSVISC